MLKKVLSRVFLSLVLTGIALMASAAAPNTADTVGTAMGSATAPTYVKPDAQNAATATTASACPTCSVAYATNSGHSTSSTTATSATSATSAGSCTGTATACGVPTNAQNAVGTYSMTWTVTGGSGNVGSAWWASCNPGCGTWLSSANPSSWDDNKGNWSQEWSFTTTVAMQQCVVNTAITSPEWAAVSIYQKSTYVWEILEYWTGNSSSYYDAPVQMMCVD